jgi:hypothetical protein
MHLLESAALKDTWAILSESLSRRPITSVFFLLQLINVPENEQGPAWWRDVPLESTLYTDNASKRWEQYIHCTAAGSEQGQQAAAVIRLREHATKLR